MELIDAYVKEVGQRLPEKEHADLEREIRTMIEDTLADESQAQGREPDEAMVVGVLKKIGPPQKLADSYLPPRYLIGPELFPPYLLALRIALAVILVTAILSAGLGVALSTGPLSEAARAVLNAAGTLVSSIFTTLGVITLVFAVIQATVPSAKLVQPQPDWDPLKLKKLDEDRIKNSSLIGEVVGFVIALLFINLFVQWIGIGAVHNGKLEYVTILSAAFYQYIPWLSLYWAAGTVLRIVVIYLTRWTPPTRWVSAGIRLFGIGLAYRMLTGPSLVDLSLDRLSGVITGVPLATQQMIAAIVPETIRLGIAIAIITAVFELAVELYRLVLKGRAPVLRIAKSE